MSVENYRIFFTLARNMMQFEKIKTLRVYIGNPVSPLFSFLIYLTLLFSCRHWTCSFDWDDDTPWCVRKVVEGRENPWRVLTYALERLKNQWPHTQSRSHVQFLSHPPCSVSPSFYCG